ncbi:RagB/SusD family nutrient uptake outer membrane protein, partial [Acinetobacter baumannii]
MMRVAEMYYIKAEAEARQGKEAVARQTLLDIVSTRDAAFTLPTESGDALIDKIFAHKRIDLYMEGVRFLDLKRLAK